MFQWNLWCFLKTLCTYRADEDKIDMDNFHIYYKISVDYSTEVCSQVVFFWGTSLPSPWQITSEARHVGNNWICTYFVSENMTLCPVSFCDWPWAAGAAVSFTGTKDHFFPLSQLRFSHNNEVEGPLIPWMDSPVCNAAEAWGVVAGQGCQSVC